jgi:PAS domain S-box-containing protein
VCYRVVDPYAIIILAGSAVRDIEESYTATVRSYVLSASLLGVLVVLLSALLIVGVLRQKQLLESQQSFNQLIELVPQLIARLDAQGRVVWANRRTLAFVGPSAEAQSQGFDWVQAAIHPDDLARVQAFVGKALAMVDCTESCEYRKRRFDAAYLWHASQITRVRDPRGEGDTFLQTDTDIHDRRMADERARVTQRLESIGQLTGGMAHDFNNLLAIVVGNLDLVMSHLPADEDSKRLQVARDAAQRGVGLVKSLLALASKQPLLPSVIDLTELLQRIAPLLRHAVGQRVRLELDVPEQALAVKVDEAGLEAALLNLTVNARDAMPHGGELAIRTHSLDGMVRIAVQDNGVGMSEAVVRRATEPFFTTKLQGHGTGLGLSMVAGFVKQSGGNFSIQSREGAGTTVEISLPQLAAADVVDRTQPAPLRLTHIQGAGPWRVLVVDDEPEVASLLREWLREDGHTAVLTSSAKDALELLSVRSFDILLTDIIMPGALDGIQLAERAQALYPAMKILLMSGYSRETATARTDVPWPLLVKPFHKADFATALKQAPEAAL